MKRMNVGKNPDGKPYVNVIAQNVDGDLVFMMVMAGKVPSKLHILPGEGHRMGNNPNSIYNPAICEWLKVTPVEYRYPYSILVSEMQSGELRQLMPQKKADTK